MQTFIELQADPYILNIANSVHYDNIDIEANTNPNFKIAHIKPETNNEMILLNYAHQLLNDNNFNVNIDETNYQSLFECHEYIANGKNIEMPFEWHTDNCGGIPDNVKVHAFLIYLEKSEKIVGGDLLIDQNHTGRASDRIIVESGKIILLQGNVMHNIEKISGYGSRKSIVIQLPVRS